VLRLSGLAFEVKLPIMIQIGLDGRSHCGGNIMQPVDKLPHSLFSIRTSIERIPDRRPPARPLLRRLTSGSPDGRTRIPAPGTERRRLAAAPAGRPQPPRGAGGGTAVGIRGMGGYSGPVRSEMHHGTPLEWEAPRGMAGRGGPARWPGGSAPSVPRASIGGSFPSPTPTPTPTHPHPHTHTNTYKHI